MSESETSNALPANWQRPDSWAREIPSPAERPFLGPGHRTLGRALTILLAACVGIALLRILLDVYGMVLFNSWKADPANIVVADGEHFDTIDVMLAGLRTFVAIITGVCTMTWLYQAYGSREADPDLLTYQRWWTIGGWLIPFISLVRPFQLMRDLYRATTSSQPQEQPRVRVKCPERFGWWWGCFLFGGFLSEFAAQMVRKGADFGQIQTALSLNLIGQVSLIAAAVLFIGVLSSITRNVSARASG
jgi:hypothetical protein